MFSCKRDIIHIKNMNCLLELRSIIHTCSTYSVGNYSKRCLHSGVMQHSDVLLTFMKTNFPNLLKLNCKYT